MDPVVHLPSQQASLDKVPLKIRKALRLNLMHHGVLQYLDDTLIHAPTEKLLFERLELFLERMYLFGVFLKPKKCILWSKEITFLGWRISGDGVSVDPEKTKAISSVPHPRPPVNYNNT